MLQMLVRWMRASSRQVGTVNHANRCSRQPLTFAAHRRSSGTYYDSQSGRHVPVHDESKVTVYLRDDDVQAGRARALGAAGALVAVPGSDLNAAAQLLESTTFDGVQHFTTFLRLNQELVSPPNAPFLCLSSNVNMCFEYTSNDVEGETSLVETITAVVAQCGSNEPRTSIGIFAPTHYNDEDPIAVAAAVANLIDNTGGGSYVVLDPSKTITKSGEDGVSVDADAVVRLSEELSYLDVAGPTIKSRLVIQALDGDHLDECLAMGINKYIVDDPGGGSAGCIDVLREAVEDQGKELILNARH